MWRSAPRRSRLLTVDCALSTVLTPAPSLSPSAATRHRPRRKKDSLAAHHTGLQQVDGGVDVAVGTRHDAVQALAAVGRAAGDAEGAVGDGVQQAVIDD